MPITMAVWRAVERDETSVNVLVRPGKDVRLSVDEVTERVKAAVDQLHDLSDDVRDGLQVEVLPTLEGPGVVLDDGDPDSLRRVLELLDAVLAAGGGGELVIRTLATVRPDGANGSRERSFRQIKAWFAMRGQRPADWTGPIGRGVDPSWVTSHEDVTAMVEQLVGWALADASPEAQVAIATGSKHLEVPREAVLRMAVAAAHRPSLLNTINVTVISDSHSRCIDFKPGLGIAAASHGAPSPQAFDWQQSLATQTMLLREAGGWCNYAHLTRVHSFSGMSAQSADNGDRMIGNPLASRVDELAALPTKGRLVDAYGVMRLSATLAAEVSLDELWRSTVLQGGAVLAETIDPAGWFAGDAIPPDLRASARKAIGAALVDRSSELALQPADSQNRRVWNVV